jgi:methylaspartate mutase epsilon subunit
MGYADPTRMRDGLVRTAALTAPTVGTLTLDSYTRLGQYASVRSSMARGEELNGYPIVTTDPEVTKAVIHGLTGEDFQIQVRHGSPAPLDILGAMMRTGLYATEGGPLSYCLPYGSLPVRESVENWRRGCEMLAALRAPDIEPHLETFGGCLLGQLCPPSLLVAVSVLEGIFFRRHGLRSVSLSYAQQTDDEQDIHAVAALRTLAAEYLHEVEWHVVLYTYMGLFPATPAGAGLLAERAARLARDAGADRLIVKTTAEAHRIPTITENIAALRDAARHAEPVTARDQHRAAPTTENEVLPEARALIEAVLDLSSDIGTALVRAMHRGVIDVPYCLHPDNAGLAGSHIDAHGRLAWSRVGAMPLRPASGSRSEPTSARLLADLSYVADRFDRRAGADADRLPRTPVRKA